MVSELSDQRDRIYSALCMTIQERIDQVDWDSFSEGDWSRFGHMATTEGVASLIHWTFKHEDISGINLPTTIKAQLMAAYYNTTAHNQVMFKELQRILDALNGAGIPVIVLKGADLSNNIYPDPGLRPMGDIDLLIREKHYSNAISIVRSMGYFEEPVISYRLKRKIGFNLHFWRESSPKVKVELHWGLVGGQDTWYHPNIAWFWDQTEYRNSKEDALFLTPTAHILYLIAHLFLQHGIASAKLIWFYDLHLIITTHNKLIDWIEMKDRAQEFGWLEALYSALFITEDCFNTPLETPLSNEIEHHSKIQKFSQNINKTNINRGDVMIQRLATMNWSSRALWISAKIFPNPAFIKWHYKPNPEWLFPLYYPYRWFEKIFKL